MDEHDNNTGSQKQGGWTPGHVYVEVSGLTGTGKSAVMGEIEIALKALGLTVEHDADFQAEKNGTHADWQEALDLYNPTVVLRERNISRAPMTDPRVIETAIGGTYDMPDGRSFWIDNRTAEEMTRRVVAALSRANPSTDQGGE